MRWTVKGKSVDQTFTRSVRREANHREGGTKTSAGSGLLAEACMGEYGGSSRACILCGRTTREHLECQSIVPYPPGDDVAG